MHSLVTTLSLTIRVYLHSFSCYCLRNTRNVAKFQQNTKRIWPYSSSRSSKVIDLDVNRNPIYDFLLVSNFGRISFLQSFSRYWRLKPENGLLSPPRICLTPHSAWTPCDINVAYTSLKSAFNPRVASGGGGGNLPPRPGFLTTAPKLFGILWNASVTFPRYLLATEPQKNFSYICYRPPNFGGKQRAPQMTKNWFRAKLRLRVPQMEKSDGYIHVFMRRQADDTSADFSWRHIQTGSRNPPIRNRK